VNKGREKPELWGAKRGALGKRREPSLTQETKKLGNQSFLKKEKRAEDHEEKIIREGRP